MQEMLEQRAEQLVNKLVARAANRFPRAYEQRWTWIFPAWFLAINLTVVKPRPA